MLNKIYLFSTFCVILIAYKTNLVLKFDPQFKNGYYPQVEIENLPKIHFDKNEIFIIDKKVKVLKEVKLKQNSKFFIVILSTPGAFDKRQVMRRKLLSLNNTGLNFFSIKQT